MLTEFDITNLKKNAPICRRCHIGICGEERPSSPNYAIDINSIENLIQRTCLDDDGDNIYYYPNHTIFKNNRNPNLISHHGLLKREDVLLNWACYNCTKCQGPMAAYFYFYSLKGENEHAKYLHYSHGMENIDIEYRDIWLIACQMMEYFKQKGYSTHVIVPSKNTTSLLYLMNASESIGQYEMIIDPVIYDE